MLVSYPRLLGRFQVRERLCIKRRRRRRSKSRRRRRRMRLFVTS